MRRSARAENTPDIFLAAQDGEVIPLSQLEEPVFSGRILGDGFAIEPANGLVYSPVGGRIMLIRPGNYAYEIHTSTDLDVLVHIGIDTANLGGKGYHPCVKEGARVKVGQKLAEVDLELLREAGKAVNTVVLITSMDRIASLEIECGSAQGGKTVAMRCTREEHA